jgi:hypothetical protein
VQREATYQAAQHHTAGGGRRLGGYALLIVVGMEVGFLLPPLNYLAAHGIANLLLLPVWIGAWTLLVWVWLAYARFYTLRMIVPHWSATPPRRRLRLITLLLTFQATGMALAIILGRLGLTLLAEETVEGVGNVVTGALVFLGVTAAAAGVTAALLAAAFGITWLAAARQPRAARTDCPSCGKPVRPGPAVGRFCSWCGESLAPWLYTH